MATALTIYTERFDENEPVANRGMSGKAFLDIDNAIGTEFRNLDAALDYCVRNNIHLDRVDFNYRDGEGYQSFLKTMVNT